MMNVFIYIMGVIIYIYKEISLWILLVLLYLKVKYMNLFIFPIMLLYYVVKTPCDLQLHTAKGKEMSFTCVMIL